MVILTLLILLLTPKPAFAQTSYTFTVNVPVSFGDTVNFSEPVTAPNVIYSLTPGGGISVTTGQNPIISNTGVLSLNDLIGDLDITAGGGISISGLEITNADRGSSQNIFKTIAVSGQSDVVSDSNTDTLTLTAGNGITITNDATNDKITLAIDLSVINTSGWSHTDGIIYLTTETDLVGIGTSEPSATLDVSGTAYVSGNTTLDSALTVSGNTTLSGLTANGAITFGDLTSDTITFNGRLADSTVIAPTNDLGADLGTNLLRFNNLYVANLNSNSGLATAGQAVFTFSPTATGYTNGTVIINPTSPADSGQLLAIGSDDNQKAGIDAEGDLTLGYSGLASVPATSSALTIYNHGTTGVFGIDTSGNATASGNLDVNGLTSDIAGTLNLSGNALTSTGDLTITPASTLNIAGTLAVNTDVLFANSSYVGIGSTAPTALLDIASTSGVDGLALTSSGATKLGLAYGTNNASINVASTDPTNLLSNPGFETALTSWTATPSYTLNDQFTTDRAAGAVNGTSAEPTGGTRTVVDTGSKLLITGSSLNLTGGTDQGNPGLWYSSQSRTSGKMFISQIITPATFTDYNFAFGWDSNQGGLLLSGAMISSTGLTAWMNGASGTSVVTGALAGSTTYQIATVLRSTGYYLYIKGGVYTNWTLMYVSADTNTTPLYPGVIRYNTFTNTTIVDNIRIPTSTWLPTPLAYDTFTRDDGAIGSSETTGPDSQTTPALSWTGGAISSNKNVITPSLGSDVVTNGTFDVDTDWTKGTGWTIDTADSNIAESTSNGVLAQNYTPTLGMWYSLSADVVRTSGRTSIMLLNNTVYGPWITTTGTYMRTERVTGTPITYIGFYNHSSENFTGTVDNFSVKPLTLSSLFSSVSTSDSDVIADANVTMTAGTQAGIVTNLDSTSSPANFLIAYHDGTNVKLDKNVGGTYTNLISTAATYGAGYTLRVITYHSDASTLKVRVYYNNVMIGTEQTVTDAGIIDNTIHGLFSTYSGNSFDNFTLFARGTGAEYTDIPAEELTATRDTDTKYATSSASVKLVAPDGNNANFTQDINVGDTETYTLTAYAYTDGSAVTSSDLELYYGSAALTTSYTHIQGDWYKLQGTFTGVASSQPAGVRVKAGKTVYLDSVSVTSDTGAATTFYVYNEGTGLAGLDVQTTSTLHSGTAAGQGLIVKGAESQTGNLSEWQTSTASAVLSVMANGLVNGSKNGLATMSKAGTVADADFSDTPPNGTMAVDSTNGRLYFKYDSDWHYVAETAGFQIPKEETQGLEIGDYLIPYVERIMADGAVHGLYTKFTQVEAKVLDALQLAQNRYAGLNLPELSIHDSLIETDSFLFINPIASGSAEFMNKAVTIDSLGNLTVGRGVIMANSQMRGIAILPGGLSSIRVNRYWTTAPATVIATPDYDANIWITDKDDTGFTLNADQVATREAVIRWLAIW